MTNEHVRFACCVFLVIVSVYLIAVGLYAIAKIAQMACGTRLPKVMSWISGRWKRWRNSRKPARPFTPGMTLEPGESAVFDIPATALSPEVREAITRGNLEVKLSPTQRDDRGRYWKKLEFLSGGKVIDSVRVEWDEAE
jgi:hypothetical protein